MNTQERHIVSTLVFLMFLLLVGFVWHRDPSFPGSFAGSMVGIVAAFLMFWPFIYLVIKRIKVFKLWITKRISMQKLLVLHVYAGVIGPILALLHSAHKFQSFVGIVLIFLMLIVVISGFVGRYILSLISSGLRDKKTMRTKLTDKLELAKSDLNSIRQTPGTDTAIPEARTAMFSLVTPQYWFNYSRTKYKREVLQLIDSLSDVEYSIKIHDTAKLWFKRWLKFHIVISLLLYVILIFHIVTEIYFGLRWL